MNLNLTPSETYLIATAVDTYLLLQIRAYNIAKESGLTPREFNIPQSIKLLQRVDEGLLTTPIATLVGHFENGMSLEDAIQEALKVDGVK